MCRVRDLRSAPRFAERHFIHPCPCPLLDGETKLEIGPRCGDILVFRLGARMPTAWECTVMTAAVPAATYSLRPDVMAVEGGSSVVE
jgi:hypothetical protein